MPHPPEKSLVYTLAAVVLGVAASTTLADKPLLIVDANFDVKSVVSRGATLGCRLPLLVSARPWQSQLIASTLTGR